MKSFLAGKIFLLFYFVVHPVTHVTLDMSSPLHTTYISSSINPYPASMENMVSS